VSDRAPDGPSSGVAVADEPGGDRALGAGVVAFVAVNLLALLVLDGASIPVLVGVEAVAVGLLVAGAVAGVRAGTALPAAAGAIAAAVGVGAALGPLAAAPWAVVVGLLVLAGGSLYAINRYDRAVLGGGPA
jgi:hypothetical protein